MNARRRPILLLAGLAVAVSGCADPYTHDRRHTAPSTPIHAQPGDAGTARIAAGRFARGWCNWNWRTAAAQQRALAQLATGELARALRANASTARIDASLARDKPGTRGTVVAIDLRLLGDRATGVIVTREQTTTNARADYGGQHHRVYRIALHHAATGPWEVTRWQPQP